jgi:hypothetical protein
MARGPKKSNEQPDKCGYIYAKPYNSSMVSTTKIPPKRTENVFNIERYFKT